MAASLLDALKNLLGAGTSAAQAPAGGNLGEVALAACVLEEPDPEAARRLRQGEALELRALGGRAMAFRGERAVGCLPEQEAGRVLRLLSGGARLGCRVVLADPAGGEVRVRLSVLM